MNSFSHIDTIRSAYLLDRQTPTKYRIFWKANVICWFSRIFWSTFYERIPGLYLLIYRIFSVLKKWPKYYIYIMWCIQKNNYNKRIIITKATTSYKKGNESLSNLSDKKVHLSHRQCNGCISEQSSSQSLYNLFIRACGNIGIYRIKFGWPSEEVIFFIFFKTLLSPKIQIFKL